MADTGFWGWLRELTRDLLNWRVLLIIVLAAGVYFGVFGFDDVAGLVKDVAYSIGVHFK